MYHGVLRGLRGAEEGSKYIRSGIQIRGRTRIPPDGRLTWLTPEDMDYITITIVDGADTVLRKIQVQSTSQLKASKSGAPPNAYYWDMRFVGWKGSGKGKWFKADPSKGDYYYYVDGELKPKPMYDLIAEEQAGQAQTAGKLAQEAIMRGDTVGAEDMLAAAQKYADLAEQSSSKAYSEAATQAADAAKSAALEAKALVEQMLQVSTAPKESGLPSWIWLAVAAGAIFLLMRKR